MYWHTTHGGVFSRRNFFSQAEERRSSKKYPPWPEIYMGKVFPTRGIWSPPKRMNITPSPKTSVPETRPCGCEPPREKKLCLRLAPKIEEIWPRSPKMPFYLKERIPWENTISRAPLPKMKIVAQGPFPGFPKWGLWPGRRKIV